MSSTSAGSLAELELARSASSYTPLSSVLYCKTAVHCLPVRARCDMSRLDRGMPDMTPARTAIFLTCRA
eukprot:1830635-Rhodomonas_salina.2